MSLFLATNSIGERPARWPYQTGLDSELGPSTILPPTTLAYRWTRRTSARPNPAGSLPLVLSTKPPRAAPLGPRLWGSTCHAPVGSVAPAALAPPGREDTRSGEDRIGSARHSLRDAPGMTRGPRWSIAGPSPSRTWATWCSCCLGPC
jgi:hypothetical protein